MIPLVENDSAIRNATTVARRRKYNAVNPEKTVNIEFIGVWDTVGAIGVPFDELRQIINFFFPIWFADNTLGPDVKCARQALSIEDERCTFHPELWNEKNVEKERIKQVWFSGVHSNVGGGYPKQGMSLATLDWMMTEAAEAGLRFIKEDLVYVHEHQDGAIRTRGLRIRSPQFSLHNLLIYLYIKTVLNCTIWTLFFIPIV